MLASAEQLLDIRMIEQLKYAYCWAYDEGDLDGLVALMAEDAVCELGSFGTFRGRAEIRDGYARIMAATGIPGTRRHLPACPDLRIDGDRATGRWYLVDFRTEEAASQPVRIFATYEDEYVREDGSWRFARIGMQIKWLEP